MLLLDNKKAIFKINKSFNAINELLVLIETSPLAYRGSVKGRHGAENQEQCEAFLKRKLNQLNSNIIKDTTD